MVSQSEKIRNRKRNDVINYIKTNPTATQREINRNCNTKVQEIFNNGIFEAYKISGIEYSFERLNFHGAAIKDIRNRAVDFENEIALKLTGFGKVTQLIKSKRGIADMILERKDKKIVIEIKDYQNKEISISQVKQLNKYLEDFNCDLGILICHNKPKKDKFIMGKNKIFILEEKELGKIPNIIRGST